MDNLFHSGDNSIKGTLLFVPRVSPNGGSTVLCKRKISLSLSQRLLARVVDAIYWIAIYPVDCIIHLLKKQGLADRGTYPLDTVIHFLNNGFA